MKRWTTVLCLSSPLWFACEKQGRQVDPDPQSDSAGHSRQSHSAVVSQSRKALESTQLDSAPSEQDQPDEVIKKIWNMVERDPHAAWREVESRSIPEQERRALLGHCAMILTERDRDAAVDWASSLADREDRLYAFSRFAVAWAAEDPAEAAEFLKKQGIHGQDDMVAVVQILQIWAQRSGADASAWALSLSSSLRQSALEAVSEQWFLRDARGYGQWLASQPQGESCQILVSAASEVLSRQIPEKRRDFLQEWPESLRHQMMGSAEPASP